MIHNPSFIPKSFKNYVDLSYMLYNSVYKNYSLFVWNSLYISERIYLHIFFPPKMDNLTNVALETRDKVQFTILI